jgi:hypothetical protein
VEKNEEEKRQRKLYKKYSTGTKDEKTEEDRREEKRRREKRRKN